MRLDQSHHSHLGTPVLPTCRPGKEPRFISRVGEHPVVLAYTGAHIGPEDCQPVYRSMPIHHTDLVLRRARKELWQRTPQKEGE